MWKRNHGQNEADALQNRFTAYVTTAVKRRRSEYIQQEKKHQEFFVQEEFLLDTKSYDLESVLSNELAFMFDFENDSLIWALKVLNNRERQVFLGRALDKKSFEELGKELGLGYKGVTALYYRTIQKIRKEMGRRWNAFF